MQKKIRFKILGIIFMSSLMIGFWGINLVLADNGGIIVNANDELSAAITLAGAGDWQMTYVCDGSAVTCVDGAACDANIANNVIDILLANIDSLTSGCDTNGEAITITSESLGDNGYLKWTSVGLTYATGAQNTFNSANQFTFKLTSIPAEATGAELKATATAVATGDAQATACSFNTGDWYCAVSVTDTSLAVAVTHDGYVQDTVSLLFSADITAETDAQQTATNGAVLYSHKLTGQDELATSLTGATVTVGGQACTEVAGDYYCPAVLAADGGLNDAISALDGYVTWTTNSTDRSANTDAQVIYTSANQYSYKITSIPAQATGAELKATATSVATGDAQTTNCVLNAGDWYCAVPLADTALAIAVTQDGYVQDTTSLSFTADRTLATDAQETATTGAVLYSHRVTAQNELGNPIAGATVTVGGQACTEVAAVHYCPTVLAADGGVADVIVNLAGYITWTANSTDRTLNTDLQATYTSANLFGLKVILADHTGLAINTLNTQLFRGSGPGASVANTRYWADTAGAGGILDIRKDGFYPGSDFNVGFNNITTSTAAQVVITLGSYAICSNPIIASTNCYGLVQINRPGEAGTPPPPTNITVTSAPVDVAIKGYFGGTVAITWTDPDDQDLQQIAIQRDHNPIPGQIVETAYVYVDKGIESFTDTNLTEGELYLYRIRAISTSGKWSDDYETMAVLIPIVEDEISEGEIIPAASQEEIDLILADPDPAAALPEGVAVGTLVKRSDMATVYFIDNDNRRHAFPDLNTYYSWFPDFSEVQTISAETLAAIPLGSNVTMKPGTNLIKIKSLPQTYAVEPYGVIRFIPDEATATNLYGANWAQRVVDVDPTFFINYQKGRAVSDIHSDGTVIEFTGYLDKYYIEQGLKRLIPPYVFNTELFQDKYVIKNVPLSFNYPLSSNFPSVTIDTLMTLR